MPVDKIFIHRSIKAEWRALIAFFVSSILAIYLSLRFPGSVIEGRLFEIFGYDVYLALPLFWLLPVLSWASIVARLFNVRYTFDRRGLEARTGIISLHQTITRLRYEDIRSIEVEQSLIDRALNVGNVEVFTAAADYVEAVLTGVDSPHEIQEMLNREREARMDAPRLREHTQDRISAI